MKYQPTHTEDNDCVVRVEGWQASVVDGMGGKGSFVEPVASLACSPDPHTIMSPSQLSEK